MITAFFSFPRRSRAGAFGNFGLLSGFGADLPAITHIALESAWLWWLFAATGIAIAIWIL